ncbi:hypothetical protein MicloDRAFT_00005930 [Microvirga lotononidis]|uniref:Uncharacterized protein n=1 Tax=Microvirga lotononidis TaxID=864069 RepID=I4Z398_9HYPH|nr:hypothetical protein MicloDRAFT_00005930 [Microvirga lotononidis]
MMCPDPTEEYTWRFDDAVKSVLTIPRNTQQQRPSLILAPDRAAVFAKAYEWIELQLRSAKRTA